MFIREWSLQMFFLLSRLHFKFNFIYFFFSKLKIWKCPLGLSVAINGSYNILNLCHYFMDLGYVAGSTPPPMQARRGPGMIFIYLISDQNCFNPKHPNVGLQILCTIFFTFHMELTRRICLAIKSFFS